MNMQRLKRGFTLIELMIILLVISILAAIAYPSYTESVRKSRRGQAQADMAELAQNLERWNTVNSTYAGYNPPARLRRSPQQGPVFYTLTVAPQTATTFTITAAPVGAHATDQCGSLSINQAGTKAVTGQSVAFCW